MTDVPSADDELLRDYTRLRLDGEAQVVEVGVVSWQGAHTPELSWVEVARLSIDAPAEEVDRARRKVLLQRKFFVVCKECSERNAKGHTDEGVCHACMERNHGVVF